MGIQEIWGSYKLTNKRCENVRKEIIIVTGLTLGSSLRIWLNNRAFKLGFKTTCLRIYRAPILFCQSFAIIQSFSQSCRFFSLPYNNCFSILVLSAFKPRNLGTEINVVLKWVKTKMVNWKILPLNFWITRQNNLNRQQYWERRHGYTSLQQHRDVIPAMAKPARCRLEWIWWEGF